MDTRRIKELENKYKILLKQIKQKASVHYHMTRIPEKKLIIRRQAENHAKHLKNDLSKDE